MFLPLGLVYGMKYIDAENPQNVMYMRIYFVVGQLIMLALWFYISNAIKQTDDKGSFEVSEADLQPSNPLGDMLGADKMLPEEKKVKKPMSFKDYDLSKVNEKIKGVFMQGLIVGGIHYKWGSALPLVMSVTMALMDIPENQLVKIHLFKKTEADDKDLARPWKAKSPFSGFTEAMDKAKKEQAIAQAKAEGREYIEGEEKDDAKKEKDDAKKTSSKEKGNGNPKKETKKKK